MTDKIKCVDCGSETFEVHTGPDGEHYFSIICLDCGGEAIIDDAVRAALKGQRHARGRSRT